MRLENIVALTGARLLTSPEVTIYNEVVFDAGKIKRGDIFFAKNPADIEEAVRNGAYAVIFDKPVQISDPEIAWLKVDSLDEALFRLLRFRMVEKEVEAYSCDDIAFELAMDIETNDEVVLAYGNMQELTKKLWDVPNGQKILFTPSLVREELFTNIKELPHVIRHKIEIIERTLFEVSFIFRDFYYERILLSPFFLPFLEQLLNFYATNEIAFRFKKFEHLTHFEILFTNKNFEPKEYGTSELVLIFEKDMRYFRQEIEFLFEHAPWARSIYLLPKEYDMPNCSACYHYGTKEELFSLLREQSFHFAFIGGYTKEILFEKKIQASPRQLTFDLF